jgi:hypothetical protein
MAAEPVPAAGWHEAGKADLGQGNLTLEWGAGSEFVPGRQHLPKGYVSAALYSPAVNAGGPCCVDRLEKRTRKNKARRARASADLPGGAGAPP